MKDEKHIIWSNYFLDYDDWKADLEEQYPDLSEDERISLMYEINGDYLDDERVNLDIQLSQPIIAIADLDARIRELEDQVEANDDAIRTFANTFPDERLQMAIQMRFISCFTWETTAALLGDRYTENSVKRLVYTAACRDGTQVNAV